VGPKKPHGPHDEQNNNNKSRKYGTGQGPIRGAVQATLVRAAPMRGWFPRHPRPQSGGRQRATTQAKRAHPARQLPVPAPATRCIEQSRCDAQVAGEGVGNRRTRPGGRDEGDVAPQEGSRALATRACCWASHCRKGQRAPRRRPPSGQQSGQEPRSNLHRRRAWRARERRRAQGGLGHDKFSNPHATRNIRTRTKQVPWSQEHVCTKHREPQGSPWSPRLQGHPYLTS
jgi:hypothetical protein